METIASQAELLEGLNEPQRQAVMHGDGAVLILAGPGSGKTRVITHRIAHLVIEHRIAPWRILAVTFTNKAAREMRERTARLLGEDAASLHMGTFHSMCARWLRIDGSAIGLSPDFVIYDDADQVALVKRVLEELHVDPRRFTPRAVLSAISNAKSEMLVPEALLSTVRGYGDEVVARAYAAYERALKAASAVDFDDLLLYAVRLFEVPEMLQKYANRYQHVLVDEFQDTNPVQYQLARKLASGHGNITVVGDPDQSIYSWRAADVRNVQYFERDFPNCAVYLLEQNYRSTGAILEAADAVIGKNPGRHPRKLWTDRQGGDLITTYDAYNDEEEGEFVAKETSRLATDGRSYGDVAVMYRTNAQSRAVEEALVRHRIPYRLIGGVRFYQRREIKDLIAYFRLAQNPRDEASLLRVINVPGRGIGDKTVDRLDEFARENGVTLWDACEGVAGGLGAAITGRSAAAVAGFVHIINRLQADAGRPLPELLDQVLTLTGYAKYLHDGGDDAEDRIENVLELRSLMTEYEDVGGDQGDLAAFLQDVALVADVDELREGVPAVTLITLHAAKGLEYPVVFLIGLEEGVLPHIRSFDDPRQMEEERRLCYVGMTRAMDLLYLSRSYRRFSFGQQAANPPSRFLNDVPAHTKRPYGSTGRSYAEAAAAPSMFENVEPAEDSMWSAGDRVAHPKFGPGVIVSAQKNGSDVEYVVAFETAGTRRLLQSYAKLVPA
ncbi:MAG: UvrD-helicase domain-containing protein [Dehalococcoidia bacterium]|uniref:ATP-dependent helicase n=1 Tax=Candidatus Amarobacter glycogenicus TaxID=3140699 RepID=UPI0031374B49|nr:UvrD-helicase domain-containing protein [Dehalococcoidia bacterium]MBK7126805.1 UvrD-helicase domain-containing protein [Dehalococcoidia bacterium]MBK8558529.1 UvrD-helicase domain-containing protein [Dehalococcoidia bacterium]MBK9546648.1 UvrD-helicase domain-containing protein [Dehalococcoidia bacterium]